MPRKPKVSPEEQMRREMHRRLTLHHKTAVRELERLRRVEEYRSSYVRIMMATSPTLIENAPLEELERIWDWIDEQYDQLEEAA